MEITTSIVNGTLRIYCHKHNLCMDSIKKIYSWKNTIRMKHIFEVNAMTSSAIAVMPNVPQENNFARVKPRLPLRLAKRVWQVASDTLSIVLHPVHRAAVSLT